MMDHGQEQEEEREVLDSIYEGDDNFTKVKDDVIQYKFDQYGENKNFVIQFKWGPKYPSEAPEINMDVFYNKHLCNEVRELLTEAIMEQVEPLLGMSMTFSLIEWLKDNSEPLLAKQDEVQDNQSVEKITEKIESVTIIMSNEQSKPQPKKKDQMSKNQKRRMWDKQNAAGERTRGVDWVDIIRHLSQTKNT